MSRKPFCWIALFVAAHALAAVPAGYYDFATGKSGEELRTALHEIINDHRVLPYSSSALDTSDALKVLDEDPANTNQVLLLYARRSEPKSTFGLSTGWNREHMWCDSYGLDGRVPAYSDLHNLRAEDANVNSARGNKYYDISDPAAKSYDVPGHSEAPQTSTDFDSWEPPQAVKGDIARALFYMDVRYEGDRTNEVDLILTENASQISTVTNLMGRLSILLLWHEIDPPDEAERRRNDLVFERYQGNRNPFVDHPEWVDAVFKPRLHIAGTGSTVSVHWTNNFPGAVLQTATNISGPWSATATNTASIGETGTESTPTNTTFYRLKIR